MEGALWRSLFGGHPYASVSEACSIAGQITEPEFDWFTMSFKNAAHNEEVRRDSDFFVESREREPGERDLELRWQGPSSIERWSIAA